MASAFPYPSGPEPPPAFRDTTGTARRAARPRLLIALLALASVAGTLCLARENWRDLRLAADITTPDSVVVAAALRARASGHLYSPWTQPPYTPTPYGPIYYAALLALSAFTGPSFGALLIAGRLLTFACFLGVVALAFACIRRLGLGRGWSLLAAGLLASDMGFAHWSLSTRPDMMALLFSLAAVYLAAGPGRGAAPWLGDGVIGMLLAGAVLTKQSYLAAPLAIACWLVGTRNATRLTRIAGTSLATVAAVLSLLVARGDAVAANLLALGHARPAVATGAGVLLRSFENYVPHGLLLALALVGLAAAWRAGGASRLLALYFVCAWIVGVATLLANSGGGENYLLEGWATAAILAVYGFALLARSWAATPHPARALLTIWVALAMGAGVVAWHHEAFTARAAGHARLAAALHGELVFSDVPYLALAGRDPEYLDPYLLRTLETAGRWRSAGMAHALAQQTYDVVLLDDGTGAVNTVWRGLSHYDAATMAALAAGYRPACKIYPVVAYIPRTRPGNALSRLQGAGCRPLAALRVNPATR